MLWFIRFYCKQNSKENGDAASNFKCLTCFHYNEIYLLMNRITLLEMMSLQIILNTCSYEAFLTTGMVFWRPCKVSSTIINREMIWLLTYLFSNKKLLHFQFCKWITGKLFYMKSKWHHLKRLEHQSNSPGVTYNINTYFRCIQAPRFCVWSGQMTVTHHQITRAISKQE